MKMIAQGLSVAVACSVFAVCPAYAMDVDNYIDVAKQAASAVKKGKIKDIDKVIAQQEELIRLAVEGALKYAEENPARRKMMHLLVLNSERMKHLTLDAIETAWHNGDYLRRNGIEIGNLDIRIIFVGDSWVTKRYTFAQVVSFCRRTRSNSYNTVERISN